MHGLLWKTAALSAKQTMPAFIPTTRHFVGSYMTSDDVQNGGEPRSLVEFEQQDLLECCYPPEALIDPGCTNKPTCRHSWDRTPDYGTLSISK